MVIKTSTAIDMYFSFSWFLKNWANTNTHDYIAYGVIILLLLVVLVDRLKRWPIWSNANKEISTIRMGGNNQMESESRGYSSCKRDQSKRKNTSYASSHLMYGLL